MRRFALVSLTGLAMAAALPTPDADACGGTFCDSGPQSMPVDQSGENILFHFDGTHVEAHIQIQYEGEAAQFAWVVPLTALPEFSVGSQLLFDELLQRTVPTYGFSPQQDSCGDATGLTGGSSDSASSSGTTGAGTGDTGGGGPDIVFQDTVGAFEITVLQGGTAEEVWTWLEMNGYDQPPEAFDILAEYVAEGALFGAFKLTGGADVDEIHPIVVRYEGNEPCVPIRLTRIAAVDDMEIRTFFLGSGRYVPTNYKHVLINPLMIDWPNLASNYKQLITDAVNQAQSGGRAFVTEFAGPASVVNPNAFYRTIWSPTPFETAAPVDVIDLLEQQGLVVCGGGFGSTGFGTGGGGASCQLNHPLLRPILNTFLPVPMGIDEDQFYDCLSCYEGLIDQNAWDGVAFGAMLDERVIAPGLRAKDLVQQSAKLTRMYTTISPDEMMEDPMFHINDSLPDVNGFQQADRRTLCTGHRVWTLPDGREVFVPAGQSWPTFPEEMPWVEDVEQMPLEGEPLNLLDNTAKINELLATYNAMHGWPDGGSGTGGGTGGATDSGTGGSDSASGGNQDGAGGCSCSTGDAPDALAAMFGLGLLGLGRRRR